MKCAKHPNVELERRSIGAGWGRNEKLICSECEKENAEKRKAGMSQDQTGHSGW